MKHLFLILSLSTLVITTSRTQPVFRNDSTFTPFMQGWINEIDSIFHLEHNSDFELRFWTRVSKTMEHRLFIMTLKNDRWNGRLFKKTLKEADTVFEIPIQQNKLDVLWRKLRKAKILTIPEEYELRDKNGAEINDPVFDGISYWFELMTTNNKRSYKYYCPNAFSRRYKEVKEFKQVVNLILLIYKHCKLKPSVC